MTTLVYNNVVLKDCETLRFEQDLQYDESKTDLLFSRFKIRVASTLVGVRYPNDGGFGIQTPIGSTVTQRLHDIQSRLSQPRKDFWFLTESNPVTENGSAYSIDQPLIIATGEPYSYEFEESSFGGRSRVDAERTVRELQPNPLDFSHVSDYSTQRYGPFNTPFPADQVVDLNNGPKPLDINCIAILGGRSIRVEFEIEVCRHFCDPSRVGDPYPPTEPWIEPRDDDEDTDDENEAEDGFRIPPSKNILSNRWSLTESKDAAWVTTKTLQGTLRVATKETLPQYQRYLVIPPCLDGYQRIEQTFADDISGLVLKYRITDRERHAAPPAPAIDWNGSYTESSTKMGVNQIAHLDVTLTGPPSVDKQDLIGAAGRVLNSRMRGLQKDPADQDPDYSVKLLDSAVIESLDQPTITLRVTVQYVGQDPTYFNLRLKQIGKPLNTDGDEDPLSIDGYYPERWPSPLPYDSETPAGLFSCYLQDPCSVWHSPAMRIEGEELPNPGGEYDDRVLTDESGSPTYPTPTEEDDVPRPGSVSRSQNKLDRDIRYVSSDQLFPDQDQKIISPEQFQGAPYTHWRLRSEYVTTTGRAVLPLAAVRDQQYAEQPFSEPTVSIVKLHESVCKRLFWIEATRVGKPPQFPQPKDTMIGPNGETETLLDWKLGLANPVIGPDGVSREYTVAAEYCYALDRPLANTESFRIPISPIDFTPDDPRTIDGADLFRDDLVEWRFNVTPSPPPTPEP
ncbi:hypothetical protein LOC71_22150 [Rhodopirellula sp. JC740]|uniref:Uncharacterized protein n=1 Tax=Rhodopirellula halodulae TaxID=2894198 RepID=A0ABS8NN43_9BACT|nr:hypothetical protein [Rhodopirellula sp. JC740]MCC9644988.1 hypothetical protein [Rhodopirellula sp. JC740]